MFYTPEVQTRLVYEGLRVPSMKIDYDSKKTGPVFAQVTELMEASTSTFLPYDNTLSPEVNSSFLKVIEDMIGGRIDPPAHWSKFRSHRCGIGSLGGIRQQSKQKTGERHGRIGRQIQSYAGR